MPKFKVYPNLDLFDSGIVDGLVQLGYSHEEALQLLFSYRPVIEKLGRYDNPEDISARIHLAIQRGSSPESWLKHIEELERYAEPKTYSLSKPPKRKGVMKVKRIM